MFNRINKIMMKNTLRNFKQSICTLRSYRVEDKNGLIGAIICETANDKGPGESLDDYSRRGLGDS
jgi:hypothetical protein